MKVIMWLAGLFTLAVLAFLGVIAYAVSTAPSCEGDLGGKLVQTGTVIQLVPVGKVLIPQTIALYRCDIAIDTPQKNVR